MEIEYAIAESLAGCAIKIDLNTYQGLKEGKSAKSTASIGIEINLNTYQGLKGKSSRRCLVCRYI